MMARSVSSGLPMARKPIFPRKTCAIAIASNVRQGMLESSNVNIVEELVEMIECQRAYEISSKMVSAVDEMLRNANQTL